MCLSTVNKVTFLVIGCQRCGTSWTDAALRGHPQVYLPPKKQSYFFDRNYKNGIDWYLSNFDGVEPQHIAVGEVATGYCLLEAIPKMAKHFPHSKLLMVMRNPTGRAYSNFQTRQMESGWNSFEHALEEDSDLLIRGQYIDQIDLLLENYPRDQLLFMLYDDLHTDDRGYLKTILEFIGVDTDLDSKLFGQRKNAAMFPKVRKQLHRFGLKSVANLVSNSPVGDWVRKNRKTKGRAYRPMELETKEKLISHFLPYNDRLSEMLQRDLSHWNRG
jgi:hypothetical protein